LRGRCLSHLGLFAFGVRLLRLRGLQDGLSGGCCLRGLLFLPVGDQEPGSCDKSYQEHGQHRHCPRREHRPNLQRRLRRGHLLAARVGHDAIAMRFDVAHQRPFATQADGQGYVLLCASRHGYGCAGR